MVSHFWSGCFEQLCHQLTSTCHRKSLQRQMSIQAAVPAPAPPQGGFQSKGGPKGKYALNLKKYGTPLPILLCSSPLHPSNKAVGHVQDPAQTQSTSFLSSFVTTLDPAKRVEIPTVTGVLDPDTQSVWVSDAQDMEVLFNRGFFGKGTLSRSDPSWRSRRIELVRGGDGGWGGSTNSSAGGRDDPR